MSWLERLKKIEVPQPGTLQNLQNQPEDWDRPEAVEVVTLPDENSEGRHQAATEPTKPGCVGFVATQPGTFAEIEALDGDVEPSTDIEPDPGRLEMLVNRGLRLEVAQQMAEALVARDQDLDYRRSCLECVHGAGVRCPDRGPLPSTHPDGQPLLHRCPAFAEVVPTQARAIWIDTSPAGAGEGRARKAAWLETLEQARAEDAAQGGPRMLVRRPLVLASSAQSVQPSGIAKDEEVAP